LPSSSCLLIYSPFLPPKPKPALLLLLSRLRLALTLRLASLPLHRLLGLTTRILDIIPRRIEKQRFYRDWLEFRWVIHEVGEVDGVGGVGVQIFDKGRW